MEKILIWADGGCRGNGRVKNIGGWGVVLRCGNYEREMKGSVENTTNNIMELTSAIMALNTLKRIDLPVEVTMDSQYVVKGINSGPGAGSRKTGGVSRTSISAAAVEACCPVP